MGEVRGSAGSHAAYVGPDRRQRLSRSAHEPSRRLLLAMAAAIFLYGIVLPTVVAEVLGSGRTLQAAIVTTIVCTILFAQGGLLLLLRWRLTGDGRSFHLGVAGLVYGFFVAPVAEVFRIITPNELHPAILQSVAQSVVGVVAAVAAVQCGLSHPVDSRLRLGRSIGLAGGALVAVSTCVYAGYEALPTRSHGLFTVLVAAAAAGAWVVAAGLVWRGTNGKASMSSLQGAPLLVLGIGSIASAWSVAAPVPFSLDASALTMSAGVLFALSSGYALLATLSDQGASAFRLRELLQNLQQYRAKEEERTHDARSALLAVQTAITALTRYREHLDDQSRTNLELAVDAELARLLGLMSSEPPAVRPVERRPFDVVEPVMAVTTAAAAFGLRIEVDAPEGGCWAEGSRDDTARVLETLLDNARRYAPEGPVKIWVRGHPKAVRVVVVDRGPGIAPEERDLVFERGRRGRASKGKPGSGLGLFAARRLMEEQGGRLRLARSGPPGAAFVVTLPAAERAELPAPTAGDRPGSPRRVRLPAHQPLRRPVSSTTLAGGEAAAGRSGGPFEAA